MVQKSVSLRVVSLVATSADNSAALRSTLSTLLQVRTSRHIA